MELNGNRRGEECRHVICFDEPNGLVYSEILQLSAKGLTRQEIADELGLSTHSITEYIRRAFDKLHVRSLPAAVSEAIRRGLLDLS